MKSFFHKNSKPPVTIFLAVVVLLIACGAPAFYSGALNKKCTIGLVYMPARPEHGEINRILKEKIIADGRFNLEEFLISPDSKCFSKTLENSLHLRSICDNALNEKISLLICTGVDCSQIIVNAAESKRSSTPIIFIGASNPVELGLVESMDTPGAHTTGVVIKYEQDPINPIELIAGAKPYTQKILLPYIVVSLPSIQKILGKAQVICKERGIQLTLLPLEHTSEALKLIQQHLTDHDAFFYIEADLLATIAPSLGKLASRNNVTLLACSPEGLTHAALTYCADIKQFVGPAFSMAVDILVHKKQPASMPVHTIHLERQLTVNAALCKSQDISPEGPRRLEALLEEKRPALSKAY